MYSRYLDGAHPLYAMWIFKGKTNEEPQAPVVASGRSSSRRGSGCRRREVVEVLVHQPPAQQHQHPAPRKVHFGVSQSVPTAPAAMPLLPSFRKSGGNSTEETPGGLHKSGSVAQVQDLRGLLATSTAVPHIEMTPPCDGGDIDDLPGPLPSVASSGGLAPPSRHHRLLSGKLRGGFHIGNGTADNNNMRTSQSEVVLSTFLAQQQSLLRSHSGVGDPKFGSRLQVPGGGMLATPSIASSSTSGSFRSRGSFVRSLLPNLGMPRCRLSHPGRTSRSMLGLFAGHTTANSQSRCSMAPSMSSSYSAASFRAHCKLCLSDIPMYNMFELKLCKCIFCKDCVEQYIRIQILDGNVKLYCPDGECALKGLLSDDEIEQMSEIDLFKKYQRYKLNTEVDLDENRAWCPTAGCETICEIDSSAGNPKRVPTPFLCTKCELTYCSVCKSAWQNDHHCKVYKKKKTAWFLGSHDRILFSDGGDCPIKHCPNCQVPIERDNGCAQMMCKRCKHVFCWYCLASLDDDFLLRHYDKGPCKNKLGHSRASVVWHRTQVIGIFAGFGVLLLVASPLLLLAAPCILCCKCKSCERCSEPEPETAATAVNL